MQNNRMDHTKKMIKTIKKIWAALKNSRARVEVDEITVKPMFVLRALRDQLPLVRLWKNVRSGAIRGLFHPRAHQNADGSPKVRYGSKESALKAQDKMAVKRGLRFTNYRCPFCDGYHVAKASHK